MPPEDDKWLEFMDSFLSRRFRIYNRVGLLLKRYYFFVQNYIKWQAGEELLRQWSSNREEDLQGYFLLNTSTLCEKCKYLLLFEEEIIEGKSNLGKPDMVFINDVPEIICVETKKIGSGKKARVKRRKIEYQIDKYQEIMANRSGLPDESVYGIMFTDDKVSDEEKEEWQRDWFNKEVLEKKFEQIARIMGINQSFFSNKLLTNPNYSEDESWFNWVWVALYLKEDLNELKKPVFNNVIDKLKKAFTHNNS